MERINAQDISSKTLVDYSNSDKILKYKGKKRQKFDNERFIQLLEQLIDNSNQTRRKEEALQNSSQPSNYNNILKIHFQLQTMKTEQCNRK